MKNGKIKRKDNNFSVNKNKGSKNFYREELRPFSPFFVTTMLLFFPEAEFFIGEIPPPLGFGNEESRAAMRPIIRHACTTVSWSHRACSRQLVLAPTPLACTFAVLVCRGIKTVLTSLMTGLKRSLWNQPAVVESENARLCIVLVRSVRCCSRLRDAFRNWCHGENVRRSRGTKPPRNSFGRIFLMDDIVISLITVGRRERRSTRENGGGGGTFMKRSGRLVD